MSKRNINLPKNKKEFAAAQQEYHGHQKFALNPRKTEFPVKMSQWLGMLLLCCIPIANIFFLLKWAFGPHVKASQRNYARAVLLLILIFANITVTVFLILYFVLGIDIVTQLRLMFV